jgi:hypothetical protein
MFKRICLGSFTIAALTLGGMFANSAEAHGPPSHRPHYGSHGGHSHHAAYGSYYRGPARGYSNVVPYGAGYIGGWQPYQHQHHHHCPPTITRRPSVGFYFGF